MYHDRNRPNLTRENFCVVRTREPNGAVLIKREAEVDDVDAFRLLLAKAENIKQVTFHIQN